MFLGLLHHKKLIKTRFFTSGGGGNIFILKWNRIKDEPLSSHHTIKIHGISAQMDSLLPFVSGGGGIKGMLQPEMGFCSNVSVPLD